MVADAKVPWSRVSGFVAAKTGLHFPPARVADLRRGLAGAAEEFGFEDVPSCAEWLLSTPLTDAQLQVLASHLTIGETYFFREKETFAVLRDRVLPDLIAARRGREQRLRLWSAGCSSGEEAYSLAILVRQVVPDFADWQVTVLATDINGRSLRKAVAGAYGEWSFRDAAPGFNARYFSRDAAGRYVILPEISAMVTFAHLNLVEDTYPSLATDTNAMDLILCRNVLMYFTPSQTRNAIAKLHHAMVDGGWLAVSPSEASQALFPEFATRNFPGVILYQKTDLRADVAAPRWYPTDADAGYFPPALDAPAVWPPLPPRAPEFVPLEMPPAEPPQPLPQHPLPARDPATTFARATALYSEGHYAEAAEALLGALQDHDPRPEIFSLLARAMANQGKLADAGQWCDRWIAADKLESGGHYLRAVILLEQGAQEEARAALQRAVYLHGDFVLAHFALGNLARSRGRPGEARKHFANALHLLAAHPPDAVLPESDGLTAARLTETIAALTAMEPVV